MLTLTNSGVFDCKSIRIGLEKHHHCPSECEKVLFFYVDDLIVFVSLLIGDSSSSSDNEEHVELIEGKKCVPFDDESARLSVD